MNQFNNCDDIKRVDYNDYKYRPKCGCYILGPAGNAAALTITPLAGGISPVSAHLVIIQIA